MPYVQRQNGVVTGCFANAQPGYAEEFLEDDHPDVVAYRNPVSAQIAVIESARDAALLAGVSWNNKSWHVDKTFQDHLTGLVASFAAGILPANATVPIRTRGNTVEQLTYTELKQLAGVVLVRVQQIWAESWAAKDALQ